MRYLHRDNFNDKISRSASVSIAVLDANFLWTRSLVQPMSSSAELFFLMPKDIITAKQAGWDISSIYRRKKVRNKLYEKRYVFPPGWFSRFPNYFMRYLASELNRWLGAAQVENRAVILTFPQYVPAIKYLHTNFKKIYYCSEDFDNYWPSRINHIRYLEDQMIELTDLTVCASIHKTKILKSRNPHLNQKINFLLHGGVDQETCGVRCAEDLIRLENPIIGHWGNLGPLTDFELLHRIVKSFPESNIVCIGGLVEYITDRDRVLFEACLARPNFHFFGARPYADIASYVSHFDVALVLYRQEHPVTRNLNPSKVRDYLAIGRPIVSTFIPDVAEIWPDLIYTRNTHDAFIEQVGDLLLSGGDGLNDERRKWASTHNWQRAADELMRMITSLDSA